MSSCTGSIESPSTQPWAADALDARDPSQPLDGEEHPSAPNGNTPGSASANPGAGSSHGGGAVSGGGDSDDTDRPLQPPAATDCSSRTIGTTPLRRITHAEYDNAVADLLGDTTHPARSFPVDTQVGLFDNTAAIQTVPTLLAEQYVDTAVRLAENVPSISDLAGCNVNAGGECAEDFIARFGRRAFRRPLTDQELARYDAILADNRATSDAATGVRAVIAAVLTSPNFLFHPELGTTGPSEVAGAKPLSGFELAGRLASAIWASVPDDELLDAAASGSLASAEQVEDQGRRMLDDPRARPALAEFYRQWLGLGRVESVSKDPAVYPDFDQQLRAAMSEESRRFVDDVLWNGDGKLSTLLTASYSFVNAPLAELYGVEAPAGGDFAKVELNPDERAGVLTQGAVLAGYARPDQSSPIKRGQWLRVRLLCQELPDPPAEVPELPAPVSGVSNRERFAMHTSNAACSGCHRLIDGLGFGLEAYDGIGRFRTHDQGAAVDSRGDIVESDIDGSYDGAVELAHKLADSAQVRDCAPTQWLRYTLGRSAQSADSCSATSLKQSFAATGGDLRELMVALTQTDMFRHYRSAD
ncbi:MAG: DUF1592 domain-containing protein [Polyangiales bacterium]